jgi:hypothetical protein
LLNGEIFYAPQEAKTSIERQRREYHQIRPHTPLGNLPRAPEAIRIPFPRRLPRQLRSTYLGDRCREWEQLMS